MLERALGFFEIEGVEEKQPLVEIALGGGRLRGDGPVIAAELADSSELLRFFAVFYTIVQIVAFLAQANVAYSVRRLGLGRTISSLPAGLGATSVIAA